MMIGSHYALIPPHPATPPPQPPPPPPCSPSVPVGPSAVMLLRCSATPKVSRPPRTWTGCRSLRGAGTGMFTHTHTHTHTHARTHTHTHTHTHTLSIINCFSVLSGLGGKGFVTTTINVRSSCGTNTHWSSDAPRRLLNDKSFWDARDEAWRSTESKIRWKILLERFRNTINTSDEIQSRTLAFCRSELNNQTEI